MKRLVWIGGALAGMVVVSVATWAVASQVLRSPAELAAQAGAPEAGLVTAPVERRTMETDVVVRGTVRYDQPIEVTLAGAPAVDGDPMATWVPEPDDEVADGAVLLEVSGRPVFTLAGALPAYRDLRPGMTGEDVRQLQESLARLEHDPGEIDGVYGSNTERAVSAWYEGAGYEAPGPSAEERERLRNAEDALTSARERLRDAERQLEEAGRGPSASEVLQAESRVSDAREQLEDAEGDSRAQRRASDEMAVAEAMLEELLEDPDTSAQERAAADARQDISEASERLAELESEIGVWVPAGEVVYVETLPQRIHAVDVGLGDPVTGGLLTITTADVVIESSVPNQDAHLVVAGGRVVVGEDGREFEGEVLEIAERPGTEGVADDRHYMRIEPEEEAEELLDASLRVRIPVESTDGEVLAVPLAAVSAGGDGSSRVEVVEDPRAAGDDGEPEGTRTRIVTVEPGLSTGGMVEVRPSGGDLDAGDQVVVGRDGGAATGEGDE